VASTISLHFLAVVVFWPVTPVLAALSLILVWIAVSDDLWRTIPDTGVVLLAVFGCGFSTWSSTNSVVADLSVAATVVVCLALVGELIWAQRGVDVLGLGDVKLIGAGVLVVGADQVWIMILLAATGGIFAALLAKRREEQGIPFGPFLAYAIFVTFLISGPPA
jgi:prepilin signal peptidase PulO-like enzyme (type II secretory pathway)